MISSDHNIAADQEAAPTGDGSDSAAGRARAGQLLRRAFHLVREKSAIRLKALDVTMRQSAALQSLARLGELSQAELGEAIGMEPANVHGLVDRLKKKGLINATRDPLNSKRMRVRLTASGKAMIPPLQDVSQQAETDVLSCLTPEEGQLFIELLRKILACAGKS